jgi:hypothetical protein
MGIAKEEMLKREGLRAAAVHFLVHVGTLQQCEYHEDVVFEGDGDLNRLWPIAMGERNKGKQGRVPWAEDMKPREFTDLLKEAYEENCGPDSCWSCDKWMKD